MRFLLEIIGIAGDIQSAAEIVDVLKENARAWWISSLGVLVLFLLLLLLIRFRVYWKVRRIVKDNETSPRIRGYKFSELIDLHDKNFTESDLSVYRILLLVLLVGLAVVSLAAGIIQLVIFLKYS